MIAALLRAVRGRPAGVPRIGDLDEDSPAFVRGLALGAFVGAAVAGSTLWRRFHGRPRDARSGSDSRSETSVPD